MKRFLLECVLVALSFIIINILLFQFAKKDYNTYLNAYNNKIELLEKTSKPRLIFVGGSNLAFGIDSKIIKDSLNMNVINMGLHAGIGIKYILQDCYQYVSENDIVILQMEYSNFFNGGDGSAETLQGLMAATNWRNFWKLNLHQQFIIGMGVIQQSYSNLNKLLSSTKQKDTRGTKSKVYRYVADGFNEYGDEESHWYLESDNPKIDENKVENNGQIDPGFVNWLQKTLKRFEEKGVIVILLPPVTINSESINDGISHIGYQYVVEPREMVLADSCYYNAVYHVNREGVIQNTSKIISILKDNIHMSEKNNM